MTQISPRVAQDAATHWARAHRREEMAHIRATIVEGVCMLGLVIMAAFAGYLAHQPDLCPSVVEIDFN